MFYVRSINLDYMWELQRKVIACAEGAAKSTGCTVKVIAYNDTVYEPMKRNEALIGAYRANLTSLGVVEAPPLVDRLGSSDVGNVSQVIPTIQPLMKIAPDNTPIHSRAFEAAAVSPLARTGTLTAAKAMAMTTLDLLADPGLLKRAQDEFKSIK
jgi:metal-dependent amidase/aminoacylase/carboxypeptidase family protein